MQLGNINISSYSGATFGRLSVILVFEGYGYYNLKFTEGAAILSLWDIYVIFRTKQELAQLPRLLAIISLL